jgi:hypothetical protein
LSVLNLILPGSGLFWWKQTLQGAAYGLCFATLSAFRHDIGAVWAIYVLVIAQVHETQSTVDKLTVHSPTQTGGGKCVAS